MNWRRITTAVSLALALPALGAAQITPDTFESGDLSNWDVLGNAGTTTRIVDNFGTFNFAQGETVVAPYAGSYYALLTAGARQSFGLDPSADPLYPDATGSTAAPGDLEAFLGEAPGFLDSVGPPDTTTGFLSLETRAREGSALERSFAVDAGDTIVLQWNVNTGYGFGGFGVNEWVYVDVRLDDGSSTGLDLISGTLQTQYLQQGQPLNSVKQFGSIAGPWTPLTLTAPVAGQVTVEAAVVAYDRYLASTGALNSQGDNGTALFLDGDGSVPGGDDGDPDTNTPPTCSVDTTLSDHMLIDGQWVVTEGETLQLAFVGADADGHPLTATALQAPAGAQITNLAGPQPLGVMVSWTPTAADDTGAHVFEVRFTDTEGASTTCSFTVDDVNQLPDCSATQGSYQAECVDGGAMLTLAASATDPDDALLNYHWDVSDASVVLDDSSSVAPSAFFPMGMTMATLTVTDGRGGIALCDVEVLVQDTTPPEVICTTDLAALWPPNHRMVPVEVFVVIDDACEDPSAVQLQSVTVRSDEADDGSGDGATAGDVDGQDAYGTPVELVSNLVFDASVNAFCGTVLLRAERDGAGDGRAYTIDVTGTDSSGNATTASCVVVVPHDRRKSK